MIDRMYQLDERAAVANGPAAVSRRDWVCARGFELVHSTRVNGLPVPAAMVRSHVAPRPAEPNFECRDFLVSVLREEWLEGWDQCRLRVLHSAAGMGPLTVVLTGPPVPLVVRLDGGDRSPVQRLFPIRIDLEIRRGGQAPGAMALPKFPLEAGSQYTIVIAAATSGAPDLLEWSEEFENAE